MEEVKNLKDLTIDTYDKLTASLELLELIDILIEGDRKLYQLIKIIMSNIENSIDNTNNAMTLISAT